MSGPLHGKLTLLADGRFTYEPDEDYVGTDVFEYKVSDGLAESNVATVTINIIPGIPVTGEHVVYLPIMISK